MLTLKHRSRRAGSLAGLVLLILASGAGSAADADCKLAKKYLHTDQPATALWAGEGGDKVAQSEARTRSGCRPIVNRIWDGERISLWGAKNETVNFNVVVEALATAVDGLSFQLPTLRGRDFQISGGPRLREDIFDWRQADISIYALRYLKIEGLSAVSYDTYDERHIPERLRRPHDDAGEGSGKWTDRPDHDTEYPDIAVPVEVAGDIVVASQHNQSIWVDVYIPKDAEAGLYRGVFTVTQRGKPLYNIPVELKVLDFALPDDAAVSAFVATGFSDIAERYTGEKDPAPGSAAAKRLDTVLERQAQLLRRHRIEVIDNNSGAGAWLKAEPRPYWRNILSGDLFRAEQGYRGPGEGRPASIYAIGTFGTWRAWWDPNNQQQMWRQTDAWESWFITHAPWVERFLYLADEPENLEEVERWAATLKANPGAGSGLKTLATIPLPKAVSQTTSVDVIASTISVGDPQVWKAARLRHLSRPGREFFLYNGQRPATGSFAIEDDGVSLRQLAWAQFKEGIQRWFYWEATYYDDYQGGRGHTDVFNTAQTFGGPTRSDPVTGKTGWNASNGDGVLLYPGTDMLFPGSSYGLAGPIASLRLKYWRRGIEDAAYLKLASAVDASATQQVINKMVPKVLWEYGVADGADPTWQRCDISWSTNPDVWDGAREELARIILSGQRPN